MELRKLGHDGLLSLSTVREWGSHSSFSVLKIDMTEEWHTSNKAIDIFITFRQSYISLIARELKNCADHDNRSMGITLERSLADIRGLFNLRFALKLLEHKAGNETVY